MCVVEDININFSTRIQDDSCVDVLKNALDDNFGYQIKIENDD